MTRRSNDLELAVPLAALAGVTGATLLRHRSETAKLERLGGAALETLLNAIDANDPVTGAHVRRVARYSLVLATMLGANEHLCNSIERVALFHDIGKIHQALFDVVHDDKSLTIAERRSINTHPARGAKVLQPLQAFYPDLPEGVLSHHERWDGSGYPRRLRGLKIPLAARIVAIADTFDAVTHARRYRPGRSATAGAEAIAEGRGTQFDPDLVDLFLAPPVFSEIKREMHHSVPVKQSPLRRRPHRKESDTPDVRFRWRDKAASQRTPDRPTRKSR